jgi:hypothetical protein
MSALDHLPLDLLLALQELMVAPDQEAKERARQRAADAGFYLVAMAGKRVDAEPIAMDEAPADIDGIHLSFGQASAR